MPNIPRPTRPTGQKWARQFATSLPIVCIKYCRSLRHGSKSGYPLDAKEREDTETPTIAEVDEPREDDPDVDPREVLERVLAQCGGVAGEVVLYPVIEDLYLAPEAGATSVEFFSHLGTVESTVCIHL